MRAGAADYIIMSLDIEVLLQRIEHLLAPRWADTDGFALGEAVAEGIVTGHSAMPEFQPDQPQTADRLAYFTSQEC